MDRFDTFSVKGVSRANKSIYTLPLFAVAGRPLALPVMVAAGREEGPVFLVSAGIHGDEFEGMEAVRRIFQSLDPAAMKGTFVGLPICNLLAYEHQTRESPVYADGLNLARVFPGRPDGSYSVRLAHELFQFVVRNLNPETDVFLDLHSGGTRYEYIPLIALHKAAKKRREAEQLARVFGIERIWEIPANPGTFNGAVAEYGIATIATETTGRGAALERDIGQYVQGILHVLHWMGICEAMEPPPNESPVRSSKTMYFRESGFFNSYVGLGAKVRKDQVMGQVSDLSGNPLETVRASCDGEVWAVRTFSTVYPGDISYMIGTSM